MGVGLKYSDNNRLWLTVYTRSFVSCPILSAFKGRSLDNCYNNLKCTVDPALPNATCTYLDTVTVGGLDMSCWKVFKLMATAPVFARKGIREIPVPSLSWKLESVMKISGLLKMSNTASEKLLENTSIMD